VGKLTICSAKKLYLSRNELATSGVALTSSHFSQLIGALTGTTG